MTWSAAEEVRAQAIERKLNDLQTAVSNLASKQQLKQWAVLLQELLSDLSAEIDQLNLTSGTTALEAHKAADHHSIYHTDARGDIRYFPQASFTVTSVGAGDAGLPVRLDGAGTLDSSFFGDITCDNLICSGLDLNGNLTIADDSSISWDSGQTIETTVSGLVVSATVGTHTYTITDWTIGSWCTFAMWIAGDLFYFTEGVDWNLSTSNEVSATNLAAEIDSKDGVSASANGTVITYTRDDRGKRVQLLDIAPGTGGYPGVHSGADGNIELGHDLFLNGGEIWDNENRKMGLRMISAPDFDSYAFWFDIDGDVPFEITDHSVGVGSPTLAASLDMRHPDGRVRGVDGVLWIGTVGSNPHSITKAGAICGGDFGVEGTLYTEDLVASGLLVHDLIQFGGTTSSFPAWKRNTTILEARLADDSGPAPVDCSSLSAGNIYSGSVRCVLNGSFYWQNSTEMRASSDGNLLVQNAAETDFGFLQLGGTTADYPAIKKGSGTNRIYLRTADDSGDVKLYCNQVTSSSNLIAAGTANISWNGRSEMTSPSDGTILFTNDIASGFDLLQFGGTTSSYPSLRRFNNSLLCYLADNSAYASFQCNSMTAYASITQAFPGGGGLIKWNNSTRMTDGTVDGNLRLENNTATDFGLLQLGGTTDAFPAIKRSGATIQFRRADDSGFSQVYGDSYLGTGGIRAGDNSGIYWGVRSIMYSDVDGDIRLTNSLASGFNLLQLGGTTSDYPAIKRDGDDLVARLADDSANTAFTAHSLNTSWSGATSISAGGGIRAGANSPIHWSGKSQLLSPTNGFVEAKTSTGTAGTFRMGSFTTTARDGLSPAAGDIIFNTTTSGFQGYNGAIWVNL
jgi:hypothetical protein